MDTITIPSPSAFLDKSPANKVHSLPQPRSLHSIKPPHNRPLASSGHSSERSGTLNGATSKPKQSKSRNGCITCKGKRLKCDESKPTCEQCRKRNVQCGGYSKAFKWRSFEEANFTGKSGPKPRKVSPPSPLLSLTIQPSQPQEQNQGQSHGQHHQSRSDDSASETSPTPAEELDDSHPNPGSHDKYGSYQSSPLLDGRRTSQSPRISNNARYPDQPHVKNVYEEPSYISPFASDVFPAIQHDGFSDPQPVCDELSQETPFSGLDRDELSPCDFQTLQGMLLPRRDMDPPLLPMEHGLLQSPLSCMPSGYNPREQSEITIEDGEDIEEIVGNNDLAFNLDQRHFTSPDSWSSRLPSALPSTADSPTSPTLSIMDLWAQPRLAANSQEMLVAQFDRYTCGILSVKDGPNENPWRTVIWPLAQDCSHLYHALASLTAFHGSKTHPELRVDGVKHMHKSVTRLASSLHKLKIDDIDNESALETALATTLVLAFSESWDQHVSTGIKHLKGAKYFVKKVVAKHGNLLQEGRDDCQQLNRLKFLCNSFIYLDVISRLTSLEEGDLADLDIVLTAFNQPFENMAELDPLMGAASTLFPLIGHVAGIITRVRRCETNSFTLISDALELKKSIEQWQAPAPSYFEVPEDPTSEVPHSLQTAEAYRWATLLYLHQAVPEIPSEPAAVLADRVLRYLATVPLSSRSIIVQIYPLLAASCEAVTEEDRGWIRNRWTAMSGRMCIGNVDKCFEVIKEVWARRDASEAEKANQVLRRQAARGFTMNKLYPSTSSRMSKRKSSSTALNDAELVFHGAGSSGQIPIGPGSFSKRRAMTAQSGLPPALKMNGRWDLALTTMNPPRAAEMSTSPLPVRPARSLSSWSRNRTIDTPLESMDMEFTVRGRLHWIGVMSDFRWEVLLG